MTEITWELLRIRAMDGELKIYNLPPPPPPPPPPQGEGHAAGQRAGHVWGLADGSVQNVETSHHGDRRPSCHGLLLR